MHTSAAERRLGSRIISCHAAKVIAESGCLLAWGRASNVSATGAFIIATIQGQPPTNQPVEVELTVPAISRGRSGQVGQKRVRPQGRLVRSVRLSGRIVRTVRLGQLVGIGIKFDEEEVA